MQPFFFSPSGIIILMRLMISILEIPTVGKHGENFCVKRLTLLNLRPAISGSGYWMQMHGKSSSIYRQWNLDMPINSFLWKKEPFFPNLWGNWRVLTIYFKIYPSFFGNKLLFGFSNIFTFMNHYFLCRKFFVLCLLPT